MCLILQEKLNRLFGQSILLNYYISSLGISKYNHNTWRNFNIQCCLSSLLSSEGMVLMFAERCLERVHVCACICGVLCVWLEVMDMQKGRTKLEKIMAGLLLLDLSFGSTACGKRPPKPEESLGPSEQGGPSTLVAFLLHFAFRWANAAGERQLAGLEPLQL